MADIIITKPKDKEEGWDCYEHELWTLFQSFYGIVM